MPGIRKQIPDGLSSSFIFKFGEKSRARRNLKVCSREFELAPVVQVVEAALANVPADSSVYKSVSDAEIVEVGSAIVDTVQLVKVRFQVRKTVQFGEVMRLVGGHEEMGAWSLHKSMQLKWNEGDVWTSDDVELPVDGVFVYKYVLCDANNPGVPIAWQQGNNQVLTLSPKDHPLLVVHDNWRGDPAQAFTSKEDGSSYMQSEERLVARINDADAAVVEANSVIRDLQTEVKQAQLQTKALREEARLGANVRLALKEQLKAEKRRSAVLEEQVDAWKQKFRQIRGPAGTSGKEEKASPENVR